MGANKDLVEPVHPTLLVCKVPAVNTSVDAMKISLEMDFIAKLGDGIMNVTNITVDDVDSMQLVRK